MFNHFETCQSVNFFNDLSDNYWAWLYCISQFHFITAVAVAALYVILFCRTSLIFRSFLSVFSIYLFSDTEKRYLPINHWQDFMIPIFFSWKAVNFLRKGTYKCLLLMCVFETFFEDFTSSIQVSFFAIAP